MRTSRSARRFVLGCSSIALALTSLAAGAPRADAQLVTHVDSATRASPAARDTTHGDTAGAPLSSGQSLDDPPFFGFWAAASRHASFRTRLGTRYHDLYLMGMRAGWTIATRRNVSLDYVVNAIPLAVMAGNPEYTTVTERCRPRPGEACTMAFVQRLIPTYHSVYGFGLAPLGVQLRLFTQSPVQLLLHANGGALWFAKPVPDPEATHFNFTAEGGGAVQWWFARHEALSVGYEFHHTSNAATGNVNPGLNSLMLIVGLTRRPE